MSGVSAIRTWTQHDHDEVRRWYNEVQEVEKAPLHERKEAAKEFYEAMRDAPELVAERVGWLIDGNYGQGAYLKAKQVLGMSKRANKAAQLNAMTAAMEWKCPGAMAVAAWKKLTPAEKAKLDHAIQAEIKSAMESE